MLRNPVMLWTLSVGFELMELTFQHLLPNFNECWWDRRGARRARSREGSAALALPGATPAALNMHVHPGCVGAARAIRSTIGKCSTCAARPRSAATVCAHAWRAARGAQLAAGRAYLQLAGHLGGHAHREVVWVRARPRAPPAHHAAPLCRHIASLLPAEK